MIERTLLNTLSELKENKIGLALSPNYNAVHKKYYIQVVFIDCNNNFKFDKQKCEEQNDKSNFNIKNVSFRESVKTSKAMKQEDFLKYLIKNLKVINRLNIEVSEDEFRKYTDNKYKYYDKLIKELNKNTNKKIYLVRADFW